MFAWRKGSSRCPYAASVVKALRDVARALNVRLDICKVTRCSDEGSVAADMISKGKAMTWARDNPGAVVGYLSRTLGYWLRNPLPTRVLGAAIARELSVMGPVLVWDKEDEHELCDLTVYPHYL